MYPKKVEVIRDLEPVVDGMVRRRASLAFRGEWGWGMGADGLSMEVIMDGPIDS